MVAEPTSPDLYPELLRTLAEVVARIVTEAGVEPARATAIGDTAAEQVSDLLGGQVVYVPKATHYKTRQRWQRIWEAFTGDNHAELAQQFGMGMHGVYRVLAVMRAAHRKRSQLGLFPDGGPPDEAIAEKPDEAPEVPPIT